MKSQHTGRLPACVRAWLANQMFAHKEGGARQRQLRGAGVHQVGDASVGEGVLGAGIRVGDDRSAVLFEPGNEVIRFLIFSPVVKLSELEHCRARNNPVVMGSERGVERDYSVNGAALRDTARVEFDWDRVAEQYGALAARLAAGESVHPQARRVRRRRDG